MKIKFVLVFIVIAVMAYIGYSVFPKEQPKELITPTKTNSISLKVTPTPTPAPTPVVFQFNNSTDLNKELNTVNPQVLNSDFEKIDKILPSL